MQLRFETSHIQSVRLKAQQLWLSPLLSISNQTSCLKGNRTTGGVFTKESCTSAVLHADKDTSGANLRNFAVTARGRELGVRKSCDFQLKHKSMHVAFLIYMTLKK